MRASARAATPVFKIKSEHTRTTSPLNHVSPPEQLLSFLHQGWGGVLVGAPPAHGGPCSFHVSRAIEHPSCMRPPKLHSPELQFRSTRRESVFDLESSRWTHAPGWEILRPQLQHSSQGSFPTQQCQKALKM